MILGLVRVMPPLVSPLDAEAPGRKSGPQKGSEIAFSTERRGPESAEFRMRNCEISRNIIDSDSVFETGFADIQ